MGNTNVVMEKAKVIGKIEDMRNKHFKNTSNIRRLEKCMQINPITGVSPLKSIDELEKMTGFNLRGNGCSYFQDDRGIGLKYNYKKERLGNRVVGIKTTGYITQVKYFKQIPEEIRREVKKRRCVVLGTHARVEPDHKDGRYTVPSLDINDYQPLCETANKVKRENCKKCKKTNLRFDATTLGYSTSWTEGTKNFDAKGLRCKGCYWYDVLDFRIRVA